MKNISLMLILAAFLASCGGPAGDGFTLTGSVQGIDTGWVYLQKKEADNWVTADSAKLDKGRFSFSGKVAMPEMWHVSLMDNEIMVPVFMENAAIEMAIFPDSLDKSTVAGSATHQVFREYVALNDAVSVRMDSVYGAWKEAKETGDSAAMARLDSVSGCLDTEMKTVLVDFIRSHPNTVVAPYLVMRNSWQFELPELEEMVTVLDTSLNASMYMQALSKRVDILRSVAIGQVAPDFEMSDTAGNPVKLSSMKGSVLLVDFWASWCGPCRAENPHVVKAWQKFHKKGFDILGVSFDQNREKWLGAIAQDKLTWMQVSDLKGWGNEAGKVYGINSIPANVLLDKDQKIIARNLRGDDLMKKLEEILGK